MTNTIETTINTRETALATFLGCDTDDLTQTYDLGNTFELGSQEYLVLTDSEADERCAEYIEGSLWAFNASFLADFTSLPVAVFEALQPQCESANDAILQIIGSDIDSFIEEAVSADGRGHFMSSYDGEENEIDVSDIEGDLDTDRVYIYRTN